MGRIHSGLGVRWALYAMGLVDTEMTQHKEDGVLQVLWCLADQAHDDGGHDQGDVEEDIDTEDDAEEEDTSLPVSTVFKKSAWTVMAYCSREPRRMIWLLWDEAVSNMHETFTWAD